MDGGYYGYPYDYRPPENDKDNMPGWQRPESACEKAKQEWEKANKDKPEAQKSPKPAEAVRDALQAVDALADGRDRRRLGDRFGRLQRRRAARRNTTATSSAANGARATSSGSSSSAAGGTYKVVKRETILTKGPGPLRPVGIQVLPDGSGILVADWNYAGWRNANTDAGRLLKLTYTGKLTPTPRPAWWVAAASGGRSSRRRRRSWSPPSRTRPRACGWSRSAGLPSAVRKGLPSRCSQCSQDAKAPPYAQVARDLDARPRSTAARPASDAIIAVLNDSGHRASASACRRPGNLARARSAKPCRRWLRALNEDRRGSAFPRRHGAGPHR